MTRIIVPLVTKSLRELGGIIWTFFVLLLLYGSVLTIMQRTFQYHWLLGLVATLFYAYALVLGLQELLSHEASRFAIRKGLAIFGLLILVGAAVFGAMSFLLEVIGWAQYSSKEARDLVSFNLYYLWLFLDMLPGLKVTETLGLTTPLQPEGVVAGLPVIAFRIFVAYGLLRALKSWWSAREEKSGALTTPSGSQGPGNSSVSKT